MRIAQVSPLFESVPPRFYGGTERVVSYLTEELVRQGHEVTLFASGDSRTHARLISPCERALRLSDVSTDHLIYHYVMLEQVYENRDDFDVIHFHVDYLHFPISKRSSYCHLTTLHGRLDLPDLSVLFKEFFSLPMVSISNAQRAPLNWINWAGTVYHGLPTDLYTFHKNPSEYLLFLGRIAPEKRVDRAIAIAKRTGVPLRIAAKIDKVDQQYFNETVKPLLDDPLIEYVGEVNDSQKDELLGNAKALIFPIDWPEPFGLVLIEALACGTPIIAFKNGSVAELVDEGVTGFVVNSLEEAVRAVHSLDQIERKVCRDTFESRFSVSRMASDYLDLYGKLERSMHGDPHRIHWTDPRRNVQGRDHSAGGPVLHTGDISATY